MELMEGLRSRRAIRQFTAQPVGTGVIEELIAAATLAPSAINLQPWAFVVVPGAARLEALDPEAKAYAAAHLPADSRMRERALDPNFKIFHGAAALIVICAINGESQSFEDCCLAAESLMLAAHAKGLGTCWIGLSRPWLNDPAVKGELGIPAEWHPVAPIILGYPAALAAPTPRETPKVVWSR
ncbi:MAG: nitroreductase family protein [Proteobacteria bacterium]|nr:nitroreductase family protein [Pseudomonadota bacterium]